MPVNKKTAAEYALELEQAIKSRNDSYDTKIGPIPDLYINPASNVFELQNERIRSVQQLLSLINDGSFEDSDLDAFVYNELAIRLTGSRSTATLVFSRSTIPTSDITVLAGFPVATLQDDDGSSVTFLTKADTTLVAANASSYYNGETGRYELQVEAESTTASSSASVAQYRITRPLRPLNGFDSVTNVAAATGGSDPEVNDSLIKRYYLSLMGSSQANETGIKKIMRSRYPQVIDVNVVYGSNPANIRAADDAGAVDIYSIGEVVSSYTESLTFVGAGQPIILTKRPVLTVTSITGYQQDIDYTFVKDSTSGYAYSNRSSDAIVWKFDAASTPVSGATISVTYTYNSLIESMQSGLTIPDLYCIGSDPLYKDSERLSVKLSANVKVLSGFSTSTTITLLTNKLFAYINSLLLNQDLEQSDIQQQARSLTSIDNFIITNLSLVGTTGIGDIVVNDRQHVVIDLSNLSLTVI